MKTTLTYILGCLFFMLINFVHGQRIYVETGLSGATFKDFRNEQGESLLDNRFSSLLRPGFGAGVLLDGFDDFIWFDAAIDYNNYHISTSVRTGGNDLPLFYDLSFVYLKTGVRLNVAKVSDLKFRTHAHFSGGWLTSGLRTFDNTFVNLQEDPDFYKFFFSYHLGASLVYDISDAIAVYMGYDLKNSLRKREPSKESYRITASTISIGLQFPLKKNKKEDVSISYGDGH